MTKAAMTSISGASLRRLVRPLLGVATVAALGIAVVPTAQTATLADKAIERGIVAKGPDGKADDKGKLSLALARQVASLTGDDTDKKKKDDGPK